MGGGKGGCSPPSSPVCSMCGDRGLPEELYRCKTCHVRFQHKYCSNLYPKAEAYRACNWCLRDVAAAGKPVAPQNCTAQNNSNGDVGSATAVKLRRCSSALHLDKPIKRQRLPEKPCEAPSQAKQVFRGKVRRYKLLEQVSS
ncbi:hypothetical protein BHE74_00053420 [Ensete ventricosum]|nr:hypothetical protein GW17_00010016 [Ensete ventricosum]RWW41112.1 hypothetical protein BHE74_00053420 [Ensete ventricosum]RZS11163.1 hypothetical protein BHM03_00042468 [Ensete ventricosum]